MQVKCICKNCKNKLKTFKVNQIEETKGKILCIEREFGIGNTWLVMAVLSIVILLPLLILVNKVLLKIKNEQRI